MQLMVKKLLQEDFNPKAVGLSSRRDTNGNPLSNAGVIDSKLGGCEFASIVVRGEKVAINNGGSYLLAFILDAMVEVCLKPFDDFSEFQRHWFILPRRVIGRPANFNLHQHMRKMRLRVEALEAAKAWGSPLGGSAEVSGSRSRSEQA